MFTGMMWFDNDPKKPLVDKVSQAAEYYKNKYGLAAELCFVNPKQLSGDYIQVERVQVRGSRSVLPGHLWIGQEPKPC